MLVGRKQNTDPISYLKDKEINIFSIFISKEEDFLTLDNCSTILIIRSGLFLAQENFAWYGYITFSQLYQDAELCNYYELFFFCENITQRKI